MSRLEASGASVEPAKRRGMRRGVRVRGRLGGVEYQSYNGNPLVIDCSLAYSLAAAGRFLSAAGIERVTYSSAYQIRKIRGTKRPSKHSFGLAIDVHTFHLADGRVLRVRDDFEQGLGDALDCIGQPLTAGGQLMKRLQCQLERSGLFRTVLDPDYDAGHYNHFHLEAEPWTERQDARRRALNQSGARDTRRGLLGRLVASYPGWAEAARGSGTGSSRRVMRSAR